MNIWHYFTDPVLRAPTIGCMLISIVASIVGVLVVLRRRSLVGETLAHAAFPGSVAGVILASSFIPIGSEGFGAVLMICAFASSWLGLWFIGQLERRFQIKSDAALCFVLAVFFGLGVLIASRVQMTHTVWYKHALVFLYGQAATMTDQYLFLYGALALVAILVVVLLYHPIQSELFDRQFASSSGINVQAIATCVMLLTVLAVVVGMRSVGVVLMSGMLIAPAVAARAWVGRLSSCLVVAALIGMVASLAGNIFSVELSQYLMLRYPDWKFSLPTGPLILLSATAMCCISLLLAPAGLLARGVRMVRFRLKVVEHQLLKFFWSRGKGGKLTWVEISQTLNGYRFLLMLSLFKLLCQGFVRREIGGEFSLDVVGWERACRVSYIHRLWEIYLLDFLPRSGSCSCHSIGDFEVALTPELERQLEELSCRSPSMVYKEST